MFKNYLNFIQETWESIINVQKGSFADLIVAIKYGIGVVLYGLLFVLAIVALFVLPLFGYKWAFVSMNNEISKVWLVNDENRNEQREKVNKLLKKRMFRIAVFVLFVPLYLAVMIPIILFLLS